MNLKVNIAINQYNESFTTLNVIHFIVYNGQNYIAYSSNIFFTTYILCHDRSEIKYSVEVFITELITQSCVVLHIKGSGSADQGVERSKIKRTHI